MYGASLVTSKGQITLPVKVRKQMGIDVGDTVIFDFMDDQLVIRKAQNIEKFFNSLPPLEEAFKERIEEEIAGDIWRPQ